MTALWARAWAYLQRRAFIRSILMVAGGTTLGQVFVVLASPLLTRLYSPESFGTLAVFLSLFSLLVIINSLRYELAIPLAEDDGDAAALLVLVCLLVVLTTVIFACFFGLFGTPLALLLNAPALDGHLGLLVVSLLVAGFYQGLTYWAIRRQAFSPIGYSKFWQSLGMVLTQLGLGVISSHPTGLTAGVAAGQSLGLWPLVRLLWRGDHSIFQQVRGSSVLAMARRYRQFPLLTSWSSFLMAAGLQLPTLFINTLYGAQVAGWFALGQRVIGLPMALIGTAVVQVYTGRASELARQHPADLRRLYGRTSAGLLVTGAVPIGLLMLIAPGLFALVFGEEWRAAGEYVQIMGPMFLAQLVMSSVSQGIYVIERQDLQTLWDIVRLVMLILVFVFAWNAALDPKTTLALYTGTTTLAYIGLFFLNLYALRQYEKRKTEQTA